MVTLNTHSPIVASFNFISPRVNPGANEIKLWQGALPTKIGWECHFMNDEEVVEVVEVGKKK